MPRPPQMEPSGERAADLAGAGLAVAAVAWVGLAAGGGEGRAAPVVALVAGLVAAVAAGRALGNRPGLVPGGVAAAVAGAVLITWPGLLEPAGAPTGYANANATLTSLGALAALGAARAARDGGGRRLWLAVAALLAVATLGPTSVAGLLCLLAGLALLGATALTRRTEVAVLGGAVLVALSLGLTASVASGGDPAGLGTRSGVRGELWAGALEVLRDEPWRGVGPGGFAAVNPVTDDRDLRWAHHGYLQAGAEWGWPGLALVLAALGWAWWRLWQAAAHHRAAAALASAAVTVVALHGTVDHVWHRPAVLVVAALLLGDATRSPGAGRRGVMGPLASRWPGVGR